MSKPKVLLVETDVDRGEALSLAIGSRHETHVARSAADGMAAVATGPWWCAIVNHSLPPRGSGLEVVQTFRDASPRTFRLLYGTNVSNAMVQDAIRLGGVYDVVDAQAPDFVARVQLLLAELASDPGANEGSLEDAHDLPWVTLSPASRTFIRALRDAAECEGPVYLYGEHGTGKRVAAVILQRWRRELRLRRGVQPPTEPEVTSIVHVPSLRERIQDLPLLAERCLRAHAQRSRVPAKHLTAAAIAELGRREWRGNVAELEGMLTRVAQRVGEASTIDAADLPAGLEPPWCPSQVAKDIGQRDCVLRQLHAAGSVSAAARLEGISRPNYIRLMRRLGILRADVELTTPTLDGFPVAH